MTLIPLFIGTYTRKLPHVNGQGAGIYSATFNTQTGVISDVQLAATAANPSYLCLSPSRRTLYCVNEGVEDVSPETTDYITSFAIDPNNLKLKELNRQPAQGSFPCHLTLNTAEDLLVTSNYGTGNIACFPLDQDGLLKECCSMHQHAGSGPNADRQEGPHAHGVFFHPTGNLAIAMDLGIDCGVAYQLKEEGLTPHPAANLTVPDGSGPRHASWTKCGRYLLAANELNSTVCLFQYRQGLFRHLHTIDSISDKTTENSIAAIRISPCNQFAYVSNRGDDSISVIQIDLPNERLALKQTIPTNGKTPRDILLTPTGDYLLAANQDSNSMYCYHVDQESGQLSMHEEEAKIPTPVSLAFLEESSIVSAQNQE